MAFCNTSKVVIIGCGLVGSTTAYSIMESGLFSEIVLIDVDQKRAEGEALDISHSLPFNKPTRIYAGTYADASNADIVIMTAGFNRRPDETRIDLAQKNVNVMKAVINELNQTEFNGVLLVVSNPVDILTYAATKLSKLSPSSIIGSGTMLDSARFKTALAEHLDFDPRNVHARIIGEHGDSELPVWSTANVSGIPINECFKLRGVDNPERVMQEIAETVRDGGREIITRKGATYFGIASAVRYICEVIMRDAKMIMPVSSVLEGEYGLKNVALSVPCVIGCAGIEFRVPAPISDVERFQLADSAATLKAIIAELDLP